METLRLLRELRHLPGQHDQQSHAGGGAADPATPQPPRPAAASSRDFFPSQTADDERSRRDALAAVFPAAHIEMGITMHPGITNALLGAAAVVARDDPEALGLVKKIVLTFDYPPGIPAAANQRDGVILVGARAWRDEDALHGALVAGHANGRRDRVARTEADLFVHEIGHLRCVKLELGNDPQVFARAVDTVEPGFSDAVSQGRWRVGEYRLVGARSLSAYSATNDAEFLAEAYASTPARRRQLAALADGGAA